MYTCRKDVTHCLHLLSTVNFSQRTLASAICCGFTPVVVVYIAGCVISVHVLSRRYQQQLYTEKEMGVGYVYLFIY